jgi:hypothetical protein
MSTQISGAAAIETWDERTYREIDDGRKLTQATIRLQYTGDLEGESTSETLMCYAADDAATYMGFEHFTGRIGKRSGSFVIRETGTYDGTRARSEGEIVEGSGTGDFVGLRGRHSSVSTHADYPNKPFTLEYDLS